MMISVLKAKKVLKALETLVVDPQINFGPAYEGAKLRQEEAIVIMRRYLRDSEEILAPHGMKPL